MVGVVLAGDTFEHNGVRRRLTNVEGRVILEVLA